MPYKSFGRPSIFTAALTWSGAAATATINFPSQRRFAILEVDAGGASGKKGEQVIVRSFRDNRRGIEHILGPRASGTTPTQGVPFRHIGNPGAQTPYGRKWFGDWRKAINLIQEATAYETPANTPNVDVTAKRQSDFNRAVRYLQHRYGSAPNISMIVVDSGDIVLELTALNSDEPTNINLLCIDLGPCRQDNPAPVNEPFWFTDTPQALATAESAAFTFSDQIQFPTHYIPGYGQPGAGSMLAASVRASQFAQSGGATVSNQDHLLQLGTQNADGDSIFWGGTVPASAFGEHDSPVFESQVYNGYLLQWNGSKAATTTASYLYITTQLYVSPDPS